MLLISIIIIKIIANTTIIQKATSFNSIDFSKQKDYLKLLDFRLTAFFNLGQYLHSQRQYYLLEPGSPERQARIYSSRAVEVMATSRVFL